MSTTYNDPAYFTSDVVCAKSFTPPASSFSDREIKAGAAIQASKLIHQIDKVYSQSPGAAGSGTAVVADTKDLFIARKAGTITGFQAAITGAAPAGDHTVNVDLQKSTGGGSFASVLSATILFNSSTTARTVSTATLSSTSYSVGDIFRVVVTVGGSTSTQGQGVIAEGAFQEAGD